MGTNFNTYKMMPMSAAGNTTAHRKVIPDTTPTPTMAFQMNPNMDLSYDARSRPSPTRTLVPPTRTREISPAVTSILM